MIFSSKAKLAILLALAVFLPASSRAIAQYKIGPDDILQISFWQKPSLDQTVTVRHDGNITISIVGEIVAAGLAPAELSRKIGERAHYYDPAISQAAVTVLSYNSQKVFINGQVAKPGAYAFEKIPDVWTLIKEAGGVTLLADLSKVTVIRGSKDAGKIETINVEKLVASAKYDEVPDLYPGDIVEVPAMPGGITGTGLPKSATGKRNVVYVTGAVLRSGPVGIEEGMDVLDAIVLSGGSSPGADLRKVSVISKLEGYSSVMTVNLEKYSATGAPRRYVLKPEDTVVVPSKRGGVLREGWGTIRDIVALTASVASTIVLIDALGNK
ncbi:MAG: polysaccharide biosynthesis/export family protein [Candidatus Zixiibacteriota bacterium]